MRNFLNTLYINNKYLYKNFPYGTFNIYSKFAEKKFIPIFL